MAVNNLLAGDTEGDDDGDDEYIGGNSFAFLHQFDHDFLVFSGSDLLTRRQFSH